MKSAFFNSISLISDKEHFILDYLSTLFKENNHHMKHGQIHNAAKSAAVSKNTSGSNFCLKGEADFDRLMAASSEEEVLRGLWLIWREKTGPLMIEPYRRLVDIENVAARRNGKRSSLLQHCLNYILYLKVWSLWFCQK